MAAAFKSIIVLCLCNESNDKSQRIIKEQLESDKTIAGLRRNERNSSAKSTIIIADN